jgi:hypothetical protein
MTLCFVSDDDDDDYGAYQPVIYCCFFAAAAAIRLNISVKLYIYAKVGFAICIV